MLYADDAGIVVSRSPSSLTKMMLMINLGSARHSRPSLEASKCTMALYGGGGVAKQPSWRPGVAGVVTLSNIRYARREAKQGAATLFAEEAKKKEVEPPDR